MVVQVRVRPGKYEVKRAADASKGAYWVVADPADIRPYGICVFDA